jgi:hypothetical protein
MNSRCNIYSGLLPKHVHDGHNVLVDTSGLVIGVHEQKRLIAFPAMHVDVMSICRLPHRLMHMETHARSSKLFSLVLQAVGCGCTGVAAISVHRSALPTGRSGCAPSPSHMP